MSGEVLPAFEQWMRSVGIDWATDAIQLVGAAEGCSGLALGVKAVRDVAEGERLCTIPKAACISIRTTQLADVIEAEELGGGLGLVLAVLHEMSLGPDSKWHGYFQALPGREYLPLFWSDSQLELLEGTELQDRVPSDREAAAEDFQEHILPLLDKYPGRLRPGFITLENFNVAAAYVASRAFGVDEWHGDAMVPLADIFNHKASVVELGAGYEVHGAASSSDDDSGSDSDADSGSEGEGRESGEDVEDLGSVDLGSEEEEEEDSEVEESGEEEEEAGGAGQEGGQGKQRHKPSHHHTHHHHNDHDHDHAGCCGGSRPAENGSGSAGGGEVEDGDGALPAVMGSAHAAIYGLESANGLHLRLEMGIVDRDEDTLEIVAASAVPAGREVHNTYGELGNAELVSKYGFALRQNPFTAVSLGKPQLLAAAKASLGAKRWRQRSGMLAQQTEVLEDGEEPFEALPNGHISPALFVALRVLCATDDEASSWQSIADALQPPPPPADGDGSEQQQQQQEPTELGAVQVWAVLQPDGQPIAAGAEGAAQQQASEQQKQGQQQGAEQQEQEEGEGRGRGGFSALLNRQMCELLEGAVQRRLAAYPAPLNKNLKQLQQYEQQDREQGKEQTAADAAAVVAAAEQRVAERAALLLSITEQEVLRDLLAAVQQRLAVLPGTAEAAEGEQKQKQEGQQGKGKGSKGKADKAGSAAGGPGKKKEQAQAGGSASRKRKQR